MGRISLFLLGGSSSNKRSPLEDETVWEQDKDRLSIDYNSELAAAGLTHSISLGNHYRWQNGVAFSALRNTRTEDWTGPRQAGITHYDDRHEAQQLSAYTRLLRSFTSRITTELGLQLIAHWARVYAEPFTSNGTLLDENIRYTLTQPYLQANVALLSQLELQTGLRVSHLSWRNHTQLEPYGQLIWQPSIHHSIQLSYGRQSQTYADQQLARIAEFPNALNGLIDSQYLGLGWGYRFREHATISTTLYYHYLDRVPATEEDLAFNYLSEPYLPISGSGTARSYGLDLQLEREFYNGWYSQLSGSLFDATYKGTDGVERPSPFNSRLSGTFTGGKEWTKEKMGGERSWGLHLRLHARGGYRYTPIDANASKLQNIEIEETDNPHSLLLPRYYTADMRISHTSQKQGYMRIWSLDIQNVANRRNTGWYYYDFLQEQVNLQEQLGIIPVLAYRIQF